MSTVDIAQQSPGRALVQDPTTGHTEIIPEPLLGPDGRNTGDENTVVKRASQDQQKQDINLEIKDDAGVTYPTNTPKPVMIDKSEQKGQAKVTDFKMASDKDSGMASEHPEHVVDIVKQSKLSGNLKSSGSDLGEFPEFPQSRPLTETSNREGLRINFDTETVKDKSDSKLDSERGDTKSPFSVNIERKPLHTAQTRSHSDYYSNTASSSRYTYIAASISQFHGFAGDYGAKEKFFRQQQQRQLTKTRRPPKLVRLATVTMSPNEKHGTRPSRTKPLPRGPSLYYEEPKKPSKVITWDEANDARPPLRIDMEGPGPTQYSPRTKPLYETNSPAWTFGSKCHIEKPGGARTSWEKTWFQSSNVWTSKVDFHSDSAWPTPTHYKSRPMLGPKQRTMVEPPSFSIGTRKEMTLNKAVALLRTKKFTDDRPLIFSNSSEKEPSPVDYDKDTADKLVLPRGPSFTHQFRREGTVMWPSKEKVPGPGTYNPNFSYNKNHGPSYSIRSLRREKSHVLGPFSTF